MCVFPIGMFAYNDAYFNQGRKDFFYFEIGRLNAADPHKAYDQAMESLKLNHPEREGWELHKIIVFPVKEPQPDIYLAFMIAIGVDFRFSLAFAAFQARNAQEAYQEAYNRISFAKPQSDYLIQVRPLYEFLYPN